MAMVVFYNYFTVANKVDAFTLHNPPLKIFSALEGSPSVFVTVSCIIVLFQLPICILYLKSF